jgi:hypothetical protein
LGLGVQAKEVVHAPPVGGGFVDKMCPVQVLQQDRGLLLG